MPKPPKTIRQSGDSGALALRNARLRVEAMRGKGVQELADENGLNRHTVAAVLNSEQTRALIKEAENELLVMVREALEAVREAINQRTDMGTAARTAIQVLKNFRLIKEAPLEIEGKLGLFIIERRDGTQVVMGARADNIEDETDGN